jgi:hypothetical protein
VSVTLKRSFSFENDFGIAYIYNFEDAAGNVIIWKTSKNLNGHELVSYELTGTVKKHGEYKGVKQTILTRCKVGMSERV